MNNSNIKILIVDDEPDIIEFLTYSLKKEGFILYVAKNGKDALKIVRESSPNLVILDIMMPGMDGIETCEQIRSEKSNDNILIIILTARSEDYSQVAAFEAGADDFVTKPVKPKVLISRIKALLKRFDRNAVSTRNHDNIVRFNELSIDKEKYLVNCNDEELTLPRKEFKLLQLLTSKPSKVFTREEIFNHLWGEDVYVSDRTIDVYIRKLREKIGNSYFVTIKGVGYKFEA